MPEALQIASLILHCRPERLPAVKANLALLDGLEIYQESPQGKLILVLEAEREEQILDTLGQLQNLPECSTPCWSTTRSCTTTIATTRRP